MILSLRRVDILLFQLCHVSKTRSLVKFLDELLDGFLIALGFAFDLCCVNLCTACCQVAEIEASEDGEMIWKTNQSSSGVFHPSF